MNSKKFRMGEIEIFAYDSGELRMIGSQALRLILKLLYRVLLLLLFLFTRLKTQYERWPAKNRSSRRR